jgi:hypothetical protein
VEPYQILGKLSRKNIHPHKGQYGEWYVTSPNLPNIPQILRYMPDGWEYRSPKDNANVGSGGGVSSDWHFDGGQQNAVMLWSNIYPTQFYIPGEGIVTPKNGEVVLFNNHIVKHRTNPEFIDLTMTGKRPNRHFLRGILNYQPDEELINKWKRVFAGEPQT